MSDDVQAHISFQEESQWTVEMTISREDIVNFTGEQEVTREAVMSWLNQSADWDAFVDLMRQAREAQQVQPDFVSHDVLDVRLPGDD